MVKKEANEPIRNEMPGGEQSEPIQNHPAPNEANREPMQNNPSEEANKPEEKEEIGILNKAPEMPEQPMGNEEEEEEGSGEAVIKIEPLLDYVAATATKFQNESWGDDEGSGEFGDGKRR
jgi:hypothetical protein